MDPRVCCFCLREFVASPFHPEQVACSNTACQQQRRNRSRQQKLAEDPEYRAVCRDSARKWRANHAGYWKQYRALNPGSGEHNRIQQRQRDLRRRLAHLANNHSALDLKASAAGVWWLAPTARVVGDLANNNLAAAQVFILQGSPRKPRPLETSCKQHPSGLPATPA